MRAYWVSVALITLLPLMAPEEAHSGIYEESRLEQYLEATLDAIARADPKSLRTADELLEAIAQTRCRSRHVALKMECLIHEARTHCDAIRGDAQKRYCHLYADILVVNRLNEDTFLNRSAKFQIMERYKDYRKQIRKELLYKYAAIVAELKISGEIEESWFGAQLSSSPRHDAGLYDESIHAGGGSQGRHDSCRACPRPCRFGGFVRGGKKSRFCCYGCVRCQSLDVSFPFECMYANIYKRYSPELRTAK